MAEKLNFSLVSPERELMSAEVDQVDIPGSEGWIGVLANHAPFMTTLAPGVITVRNGDVEKKIFVRGGFAEISPAGLTVLAEDASPLEELDADAIAARVQHAQADLENADTDAKKQLARLELDRLQDI